MAKRKAKAQKPPEDYLGNLQYLLDTCPWKNADKLVLGCDPGSKNFGISLVGIEDGAIRIYANSVMMNPVNNLVEFNAAYTAFTEELKLWMTAKPHGMVAERFQTRGNGGPLIEQVSAMIGIMKGRYHQIPLKLTIASTWKNRFNRRFSTDLKEIYPELDVQPHQLDAALIGVFGIEEGLQETIDYDVQDIIAQVEATSLIKLKSEKVRK